jgi:dipeptidyl aminopeptidase/acylaminoacyl peptidase
MKYVINLIFLFFYLNVFAQKPVIDMSVFGKWPAVGEPKITNNGQYALYSVSNTPLNGNTCIIMQTSGKWKKELVGIQGASFSADSRKAFFQQGEDSIGIIYLGTEKIEFITSANSFQLFKKGSEEWIAYRQSRAGKKELVLQNFPLNTIHRFGDVDDFMLSKNSNTLVYTSGQSVYWVNLNDKTHDAPKLIWQGQKSSGFLFDNTGTQLAFIVSGDSAYDNSIWHYAKNNDRAQLLVGKNTTDENLFVEQIWMFSFDEDRLFYAVKEKEYEVPLPDAVKVDVWSYTDTRLQSQQLVEDVAGYGGHYKGPKSYYCVVNISDKQIIRLQQENEECDLFGNEKSDDWCLVTNRIGEEDEWNWNRLSQPKYYLMSTRTGERKQVDYRFRGVSPNGVFLYAEDIYADYYTYELATGKVRKITSALPDDKVPKFGLAVISAKGLSFWGKWLANDEAMLIYDHYDVWQVDPRAIKRPVNLTNGYGRRHKITFRFIENDKSNYSKNDKLILDAFDENNKNNGFYAVTMGRTQDPIPLVMKPSVFAGGDHLIDVGGDKPIKAANVEVYMVRESSATESPNYCWTKDFKTFLPLSNVFPEKNYNWLTSELRAFKTLDGRMEQGVLYKPENFDSTKKYPVIVYYYEKKSERLNQYITPGYSDGDINIPYFVSNGYLVFTPDIHYTIGKAGNSAYNSIVGAGEYLASLPWVNAKKMGISGHSFGGFETNYVITHSNLFAAACSDAGTSNEVNRYNSFELNSGKSLQQFIEIGQNRMGSSLWTSLNTYIENSPLFEAHKIQTPVLMISNKLDAIVHFDQGVQFFTALRRLGKKAWMLQYDGEQHSLIREKNRMDLTYRMTQFFDHYLKDAPAPKWMVDGIPAKRKGIETGYELDRTKTPGRGLLTEEEEKKVAALQNEEPVRITQK